MTTPDEALRILSEDPAKAEALLLDDLLDSAGRSRAGLDRLIMLASLPRSFDAPLLAALADREEDEDFALAMAALLRYSFVQDRADGRWVMHNSTRGPLLRRWQTPEHMVDLGERLEVLRAIHLDDFRTARTLHADFADVGAIVRGANPRRYQQLGQLIEDRLIRPALEAQHVAVTISPDVGLDTFRVLFDGLMEDNCVDVVGTLVRALGEEAAAVPGDAGTRLGRWARYYEARTLTSLGRPADSERELRELIRVLDDDDPFLATWAHAELSIALRRQYRFEEALRALDEELAIHSKHNPDPLNAYTPFVTKADVQESLWDGAAAIDDCRRALERAIAGGHVAGTALVRLKLTGLLAMGGDPSRSTRELVEALRSARVALTDNRLVNSAVADAVVEHLGRRSARLLAAASAQHRHVMLLQGPSGSLDVALKRAAVLTLCGATTSAVDAFEQAARLAETEVRRRVPEVQADRVQHAAALGEHRRGIDHYRRVLATGTGLDDEWEKARCFTNFALLLLDVGQLEEALEHILEARSVWREMGHERAASFTHGVEAEILRRCGCFADAQVALDSKLPVAALGFEAFAHAVSARLALDLGQPSIAAARAADALAATACSAPNEWVQHAALTTMSLGEARNFAEIPALTERLHRRACELRDFVAWRPTTATTTADDHAGRALRIMVAGLGTMDERLGSAQEHLEVAVETDPDLGWFRLELALVKQRAGIADKVVQRHAREAIDRTDDPHLRSAIETVVLQPLGG